MRKKIAANCKGCKALDFLVSGCCSLNYETGRDWKGDVVPVVLCPKPTTPKALKKEMKK